MNLNEYDLPQNHQPISFESQNDKNVSDHTTRDHQTAGNTTRDRQTADREVELLQETSFLFQLTLIILILINLTKLASSKLIKTL